MQKLSILIILLSLLKWQIPGGLESNGKKDWMGCYKYKFFFYQPNDYEEVSESHSLYNGCEVNNGNSVVVSNHIKVFQATFDRSLQGNRMEGDIELWCQKCQKKT